jgi:hypothetical protein
MEPRFFKPLGITDLRWDLGPGNINPGGNGLTWTTADCLKLGAVYAQGGMWQGRRILPAEWVKAASHPQVAEGEYGYQWWIGPNNAFYALGLFSQLSIVFPDHDAVLAVTSAIDGSKNLLRVVWEHFPSAFAGGATAEQPSVERPPAGPIASEAILRDRTSSLRLLPPLVPSSSPVAAQISGRTFIIESNEDQVASVRLDFTADRCAFLLKDARGEHKITNGLRDWIEGTTSMTGNRLHHEYQLDDMRVVASGRWLDDHTFEMTWQFVESAFRDRALCRFDGDHMTLDRSVNVNSAARTRPQLRGKLG